MSKKAEEVAWKAYPYEGGVKGLICENSRQIFIQGYKQAEKDLGWHSVDECLPEMDEEVIVLMDEHDTAPIYKVGVAHIVDRRYAMDYNGWNTPGVKFWMPCPKIPEP